MESGDMKRRNHHSNGRFYRNLVIFSALIALIPVLVLGIYAAAKTSDQMREALFQADEEYLNSSMTRMEDMMQAVENYYAYSGLRSEIVRYTYQDLDFQDYEALTQIRQFLRGGSYFQDTISGVYLVNFQYSYVIGVSEAGYFETAEEDNVLLTIMMEHEEQKQTIFWAYVDSWEGLKQKGLNDSYEIDGLCLFIKLPMYISSRQAAIVVSFSAEEMQELFMDGHGETPLILISDTGKILYHQDAEMVGQDYRVIPELSEMSLSEETGIYRSGDIYVSTLRDENGYTYVKMTSGAQVRQVAMSIYWVVLLLCAVILLVLGGMIFVISRRLYSPVRKVYDRAKALLPGNNPQASELEVIERGLNQLSDENVMLQERMSESRSQLQELFFIKLLRGHLSEDEMKAYQMEEQNEWDGMKLAVIWYQNAEQSGILEDYARVFMAQLVSGVIPEKNRWPVVYYERRLIVLIRDEQTDTEHPITRYAEEIMRRAESMAGIKVNISISDSFMSLSQVRRVYQESNNALLYKTFYGQEMIVYTEFEREERTEQAYPAEKVRDLHYTIQNCNTETAKRLVQEIVQDIFGGWREPIEYRLYMIRVASDVLSVADELEVEYSRLYPNLTRIYESVEDLNDVDSACCFLWKDLILPILSYLQERRSNHQNQTAELLMEKIRQEYDTDLTLESCATELHYHSMYLWQIFKDRYGMTFSQCLDNTRFQKAKEWLASTSQPIAEIAARLRYSNAQNFIRSFKKKEGMTPGQYRELHGKTTKE